MTIYKYSQLQYTSAATKEQINSVAKRLNIAPEELLALVKEVDISGKRTYEVWLLKQMGFMNIRLPEDAEKVIKTLKNFEHLNNRNQLKFRNINQYSNIHTLEEEIRDIVGDELKDVFSFDVQNYLSLPGVTLVGQNSNWLILKVTDPESLTKTSDSTKWCTLGEEYANKYIRQDGAQFVTFKKESNKLVKYAQFSPTYDQFKDIYDKEIPEIDGSLYDLIAAHLPETVSLLERNKDKTLDFINRNSKIKIEGDIELANITEPLTLPENLYIDGNLEIKNCPALKELPANLSVFSLSVENLPMLVELPPTLHVADYIFIHNCENLTNIPSIGSRLNKLAVMNCANLISISPELKIKYEIYISDCPQLQEIDINVNKLKALTMNNCPQLKTLPQSLDWIQSELIIVNCNELQGNNFLPANLEVGYLEITNCSKITGLPFKVSSGGSIIIRDCNSFKEFSKQTEPLLELELRNLPKLTEVPSQLEVKFLTLDNLAISNLSLNGEKMTHLHIESCNELQEVSGNIKEVLNNFEIVYCKKLKSLPESLEKVLRNFYISGCLNLTTLIEDLKVWGSLTIKGCKNLTALPPGLAVMKQFTIEETGITQLPRDLQVIGYIHGENPETGREWQEEYEAMQKTSNLRKLSVR